MWRGPALNRSVIVNLKTPTKSGIRGVLWGYRGPWVVLKQAALVADNAAPMPIDGDALVHTDNVAFIQVEP